MLVYVVVSSKILNLSNGFFLDLAGRMMWMIMTKDITEVCQTRTSQEVTHLRTTLAPGCSLSKF